MKDIIEAVKELAIDFGLTPTQITYVGVFLVVCFLTGKGVKYAINRVQDILKTDRELQAELRAQLQGSYLIIKEQQEYIVALRKSKAKHLEQIDVLEAKIEEHEVRLHKVRLFLVDKGFGDYEI